MRDLFLININGNQYGIWQDELLFCGETRYVNQISMLPDYIAGICSIEKWHSITLADLQVCLGFAKESNEKHAQAHALLLAEGKNFAGFCVYGDLEQIAVAEKDCHSIPEYIKSEVINRCVMFDQAIIPIINIKALFARLLNEHYSLEQIEPSLPDLTASSIKQVNAVQIFTCADQLFACPAAMVTSTIPLFRNIVSLPATPDYIAGMIEYYGQIIPIINLAKWLELNETKTARTLLICVLEGYYFGFLVDKSQDDTPDDFLCLPYPKLLQFYCLQHALIIDEKIIPVVDFNLLVTSSSTSPNNRFPTKPHYSSNASTHLKFGKAPITVVPISLLGVNHAIPKEEVKQILPITPYQNPLKNYPFVQGMLYYQGEILPVIDLANYFESRSKVTDDWKMLLISNGNFRAFILAEKVSNELTLSIEQQQKLPFVLESPVVYGCYSHQKNIDLILNIQAIVVHADKSVVTQLFDSYTKEIESEPVDSAPEILEPQDPPQKSEPKIISSLPISIPYQSLVIEDTYQDNATDNQIQALIAPTTQTDNEELFSENDLLEEEHQDNAEEVISLDNEITEEQVEQDKPEKLIAPDNETIEEQENKSNKTQNEELQDAEDFLEALEKNLENKDENKPLAEVLEDDTEKLITAINKNNEELLGTLEKQIHQPFLEEIALEKIKNRDEDLNFFANDEDVEKKILTAINSKNISDQAFQKEFFLETTDKAKEKTTHSMSDSKDDISSKYDGFLLTLSDLQRMKKINNSQSNLRKNSGLEIFKKRRDKNDLPEQTIDKKIKTKPFRHFFLKNNKNIYYMSGAVLVLCGVAYYFYKDDNEAIEKETNQQPHVLFQPTVKKQPPTTIVVDKTVNTTTVTEKKNSTQVNINTAKNTAPENSTVTTLPENPEFTSTTVIDNTQVPTTDKKTNEQNNIAKPIEKKPLFQANAAENNTISTAATVVPKNTTLALTNNEKTSVNNKVTSPEGATSQTSASNIKASNKQYLHIKIMIPEAENTPLPKEGENLKKCYSIKYTLKPNDMLWDIAVRFTGNGYNYKKIARDNHIKDANNLYWGTSITIKNVRGVWCAKNN